MRLKGIIASAVAAMALLLVSSTAAHADHVQVHESTELFHASGGTSVFCAIGCTSFTVGDTSTPQDWEILEKGWHDIDGHLAINPIGGETTVISYTVGNDGFASAITSFHVPTPQTALAILSPFGWEGEQVGNMIWWTATTPGAGIVEGTTLDTFVAVYGDHQGIIFDFPAAVDLADGSFLESDDWVVSTIPVPGAFLLGAMGLAVVGWIKRRMG